MCMNYVVVIVNLNPRALLTQIYIIESIIRRLCNLASSTFTSPLKREILKPSTFQKSQACSGGPEIHILLCTHIF